MLHRIYDDDDVSHDPLDEVAHEAFHEASPAFSHSDQELEFAPAPRVPVAPPPAYLEQRVEQLSLATSPPFQVTDPCFVTMTVPPSGAHSPSNRDAEVRVAAADLFQPALPFLPRLRASILADLGDGSAATSTTVLLPANVQWRDRVILQRRAQCNDRVRDTDTGSAAWQGERLDFVSRVLVHYYDTPAPSLSSDAIRGVLVSYAREREEDEELDWVETEFGLRSSAGEFIPRVVLPWHDACRFPAGQKVAPSPCDERVTLVGDDASVFTSRSAEEDLVALAGPINNDFGQKTPHGVVGIATITSASVEAPNERLERFVNECRKRCEGAGSVQRQETHVVNMTCDAAASQRDASRHRGRSVRRRRGLPVELWIYILMNYVPRQNFGTLRLCSVAFDKLVCSLCMFWRMRLPSAAVLREDHQSLSFLANRCIVHELLDGVIRGECETAALRHARCLRGCCYAAWRHQQEARRARRDAHVTRWKELYLCRTILTVVACPRVEASIALRYDGLHAGVRVLRDGVVFGTAVMVVALLVCAVLIAAQLWLSLVHPELTTEAYAWQAWMPTWMVFVVSILIASRFLWCSRFETILCGGVWLISTQLSIILLFTFRLSNSVSSQQTTFSSCILPSSLAHPVVACCGLLRIKDFVAIHRPMWMRDGEGRLAFLIAALVGTAIAFALLPVMLSRDLDRDYNARSSSNGSPAESGGWLAGHSFVATGVVLMAGSVSAFSALVGSCHCVGWTRFLAGAPWFFAGISGCGLSLTLVATTGAVVAFGSPSARAPLMAPLAYGVVVAVFFSAIAFVVDCGGSTDSATTESAVTRWIYSDEVQADTDPFDDDM